MIHPSAAELLAAVVLGVTASAVGGYFGGTTLAAKFIGRDLSGFLGMLYGPAAGATGVVLGVAAVAIATR
jgi:hypothetical protein